VGPYCANLKMKLRLESIKKVPQCKEILSYYGNSIVADSDSVELEVER
jgi:hypothetical protein